MRVDNVAKPPTWVRMSRLNNNTYKDIDPVRDVEDEIANTPKPYLEEPALVHPFNTSVIKIRNNGIIDLWVPTNQGIRVDPNTRTVNVITDGMKEHLNYFRAWITEDAHWWVKKSIIFNTEESFFRVNAYREIYLNAYGPGANIIGTATKDIRLLADGNIDIIAKGNVNIKGRMVYINS